MNMKYVIGFLMLGFVLVGCSESGSESSGESAGSAATMPVSIQAYLDLKDALVEGNLDQAKVICATMPVALADITVESYQLTIAEVAKNMAEASDIEGMRVLLPELTNAYMAYLSNSSAERPTLYYQFCPMAFDNQGGFWISDKEEIMNPYFGDMMLHCGTVQQKL